jgi:ribosomal protein S18 acetylase RimI-like enzyme
MNQDEYNRARSVVEQNGTIFRPNGYLLYRQGMAGSCEIFDIVAYERGKGTGTDMLNELKEKFAVIYCFTIEKNRIARKFYEKTGFQKVASLPDFYTDFKDSDHRNAAMYIWRR